MFSILEFARFTVPLTSTITQKLPFVHEHLLLISGNSLMWSVRATVFPIYRARAVNEQCKFFTNRMDSSQRSYLLSLTKMYMGLEWLTPSLTEMVNMVIIIPATHQHVSIFSVSMAAC